jgi:hypothetical protein
MVSGFAIGRVSEHKTPSLHINPPDAKPALCVRISFLSGEFDKVVFQFHVKIDFCF